MHHEMEMLVEAGLTPMQALKAATSWSAELLQGKNGGPRQCENWLDSAGQFCGPCCCERRSFERHLEHQEDRTGYERRALGRASLPSRILHVRPARSANCSVEPRAHNQLDGAKPCPGRLVVDPRDT